jgi:uncharacterized repeat protein (TIGR03803 family)
MPQKKILFSLITLLLVVSAFLVAPITARGAGKERVLYSLCPLNGCTDGLLPLGYLIFDSFGNLYGVTGDGGANGWGAVFRLTPSADGKWKEKVLHSFNEDDGSGPVAGLIVDGAGNFYGTTSEGGVYYNCGYDPVYGCGAVFELTPGSDGGWKEKVIHNFNGQNKDGFYPRGSLVSDAAGSLYGTTASGGAHNSCLQVNSSGCGAVVRLTRDAKGQWKESVIYSFKGSDGWQPLGNLIFDKKGNLYGTTSQGGGYNRNCYEYSCGTVFELSPSSDGLWTETVLHHFNGNDGAQPQGSLIFDAAGNLYGATSVGGPYGGGFGGGAVFELMPTGSGQWEEKVLHYFGKGKDGYVPYAGLTLDAAGNLYGTTTGGGAYGSNCGTEPCGTVFQLMPGANGQWSEKVLHSFSGSPDGNLPEGSLTFDSAGNLYGTTAAGGGYDAGAVFEITP